MLRPIEKFGLQRTFYLAFGAALLVAIAAAGLALEQLMRRSLEGSLERQGRGEARLVAAQVAEALVEGGGGAAATQRAQQRVEGALRELDDAYLLVLRPDRRVLARAAKPRWAAQLDEILEAHARRPDETFREEGGLYMLSQPVSGADGAGPAVGFVLSGQPADRLDAPLFRARAVIAAVLLAAGAALMAALWLLAQRLVVAPLAEIGALAGRMSESDLAGRAERRADDELGALADSLNRIGASLAGTVQRVRGVSEGVGQVIARISRTGSAVAEGTGTVTARVGETSAAIGAMLESLNGIGDDVEVLARSAEESSASILEMAATNDEVAANIAQLAASVEETTAAIEQMTYSIKEVAGNIEQLSTTAEETSLKMKEMDESIGQVESNANETANLSAQASRDAEQGAEAISRTLAGIDKIKESSKEAAAVIQALGAKIGVVGTILNVIDDVAEQTNLLALNAAILAAQSGEHGKGFAVVADEIKDLAERTGASTKEIAELIDSVQLESQNAGEAMQRGVRAVDEGVRLGQEAATALGKIRASSQRSTKMVQDIAGATVEQARGSKAVTTAISRIAETVQQIAKVTGEQTRGSEQMMKGAEKMKVITKHVERSSQEQARGSKQITRSMESISQMVKSLGRAQKDQSRDAEAVVAAVKQIRGVAEAQADQVRELEAAIGDLAAQAEVLRAEVKRFRA